MQERAKADADRLLAEARAEAERAHRQLEEELLEKKQEAVQVLAAASQQAEQEARNLAQARAHVAKVRGCIREALFQIDALLSTVGEGRNGSFPHTGRNLLRRQHGGGTGRDGRERRSLVNVTASK